jgi:hypothetical protein
MEIWKEVKNHEGIYEVSNVGRVKSLSRIVLNKGLHPFVCKEKLLKLQTDKDGYIVVSLTDENKIKKMRKVHQLVAESFLNHKPNGQKLVIDHINSIKNDNRVENLNIVSSRENTHRKKTIGTSKYIGVNWSKSKCKWQARIGIKFKRIHLGTFNTEIEAHEAYQKALALITIQ